LVAWAGAAAAPVRAELFTSVGIRFANVDWRGAEAALRTQAQADPRARGALSFPHRAPQSARDTNSARAFPAFVQLNAASEKLFAGIGRAPIPVLLPFDTQTFLADRMRGAPLLDVRHYLGGFSELTHFSAGPAGYSAIVTLAPDADTDLPGRVYPKPVEIQITGSLITTDLADPIGGGGNAVRDLSSSFPNLRRLIREGYVRYAFTRFGVHYVVAIDCLDSRPRRPRLACREASPIAEKFLEALNLVGGLPAPARPPHPPAPIERPAQISPDFTYWPAGAIIEGSGYRDHGGLAETKVFARIRYPLKDAPSFANSQSFLNWGDCYHKGRVPRPRFKGQAYRCRSNTKALVYDEGFGENYTYPWRDNFCETRDLQVGQCPGGVGHQGQDIRPARCAKRNEGADRCRPGQDKIVAVREGEIFRTKGQDGAYLIVNERNEHFRVRYMHMVPARMDADGLVHGRHELEGEVIGLMSNYQDYPGGTSLHLHFDMQVFTPDGWIWVNPYPTLITAYERLIGARGRVFVPSPEKPPGLPQPRPRADQ